MIREMSLEDLNNVLEIEKSSFQYPWNEKQLQDEFNKKHSIKLVHIQEDTITGYVIAWNIINELEIGTIATNSEHRKSGIASKLLHHLFKLSQPESCFLEVSSINTNAINFYNKLNFEQINIRKKYYQDGSDAIIMKLTF